MKRLGRSLSEESGHYKAFNHQRKFLTELYTATKWLSPTNDNLLTGLRVLDLTCGGGELIKHLICSGASFVAGVDSSEEMIQSAHNQLSSIDSTKYSLHNGDPLNSEFLLSQFVKSEFDAINLTWLINYLPDYPSLQQFFSTCKSLLKPSGKIFGIYPNESLIEFTQESIEKMYIKYSNYSIVEIKDKFAVAELTLIDPDDGDEYFKSNILLYRRTSIAAALEAAGFDGIKIGGLEINPEYQDRGFNDSQFRAYTEEIGVVNCFLARSKN